MGQGDKLKVHELQTNFVAPLCRATLFVEISRHSVLQLPKHLDWSIPLVRKKFLHWAEEYVRGRFVACALFDPREKQDRVSALTEMDVILTGSVRTCSATL
jgi:hypothetical protein